MHSGDKVEKNDKKVLTKAQVYAILIKLSPERVSKEKTKKVLKIKDKISLSLTFCLDDYIHELNLEYRGIDRETDVISFAFEDDSSYKKLVSNQDVPRDIGEIFICVDVAKRQAEEYKHSFEREMAFLFVHGLLHLLGYDHMSEEDEKVMFKLQDEIMEILSL